MHTNLYIYIHIYFPHPGSYFPMLPCISLLQEVTCSRIGYYVSMNTLGILFQWASTISLMEPKIKSTGFWPRLFGFILKEQMKMKYWAFFQYPLEYTATFRVYGKCEISLVSQIFASLFLEYIKKKHLRGSLVATLRDDSLSQVRYKKWKKKQNMQGRPNLVRRTFYLVL